VLEIGEWGEMQVVVASQGDKVQVKVFEGSQESLGGRVIGAAGRIAGI
jgi:hypothetical protein